MTRRLPRLLLVLTCVSALVALTPLGAQAQGEVTITVGARGELLLRGVAATVPVEITCGPMEVDPRFTDTSAELQQAVRHRIAHGFGFFPEQPIVCDGTPHPNTFTVEADTSGPPFRKGDAVVEVVVQVGNEEFCCPSGSSGFQIIKLN
jgi:hypothetical protein